MVIRRVPRRDGYIIPGSQTWFDPGVMPPHFARSYLRNQQAIPAIHVNERDAPTGILEKYRARCEARGTIAIDYDPIKEELLMPRTLRRIKRLKGSVSFIGFCQHVLKRRVPGGRSWMYPKGHPNTQYALAVILNRLVTMKLIRCVEVERVFKSKRTYTYYAGNESWEEHRYSKGFELQFVYVKPPSQRGKYHKKKSEILKEKGPLAWARHRLQNGKGVQNHGPGRPKRERSRTLSGADGVLVPKSDNENL